MPRKSETPIEYRKLRLFKGDFDAMGVLYPSIGATVAIRTLIRKHIEMVRASAAPIDLSIPTENDLKELLHD